MLHYLKTTGNSNANLACCRTGKLSALIGFLMILSTLYVNAKEAKITSPDGAIAVAVMDGSDGIARLTIERAGAVLLPPSPVKLVVKGFPQNNAIKKISKGKTVTEHIDAHFYRQKSYDAVYNTMDVDLSDGTKLEVRAFNEGIAYRFKTKARNEIIVENEIAQYKFAHDTKAWISYSTNKKNPYAMAFQNFYDVTAIENADTIPAFSPLTLEPVEGVKVTVMESDLQSYPQMFYNISGNGAEAIFPHYPAEFAYDKVRMRKYVTATEPYIAKTEGTRNFPWRVFAITANDCLMPVNNLVYTLAEPSRIANVSALRPGKVAWEWWNDWGLKGVPFKAGINTATYKAYIDFAAANSLEYVILDEGWYESKGGDMLTVVKDIDLEELIAYGKSKNVGIILWTVFNVLDSQLEEACDKYEAMGVAGFKVDFLDRADQEAVEMTYRIAEATAEKDFILDLHGFYTPTGLNRTFPNIVNFESVFGMEEMKWSPETVDMPLYEVTFPYIRMMAGPVDFTPGAMNNASRKNWRAISSEPMSQGTRAHHLATYIVYDSPLTMLADAPSNYTDAVALEFLRQVPVEVDTTIVVDGKIGEYIVTARKDFEGHWWIGGMTSWEPRDIDLDFSFLPGGEYQGYIIRDGANADKIGTDYVKENIIVKPGTPCRIHLASGGGFVMKL